jgi:iron complex outermembrane receptor protein
MSRHLPVLCARHRLAAPFALAGVALATAQLCAQAQTAPAAPAAAASSPVQLQVVTVTAERRVENIQDVPSSISTLSGEGLDVITSSGQDVRELSGRVPSLNIESSFGRAFPRFYIRGYGNTDFRLNASQPVSLVYDDVVQENPILKGFPIFDMDNVEVLRGPQGSLFGRNTPAGVVKFESAKPTRKLEGYGSLSVGTYSTVNAEGAVNVPLSPDSALRVSVLNETRDNWVHNTIPTGATQNLEGYRDSAARVQYLLTPSTDLSLLFNLHGRNFSGSSRLFRANIIQPGTDNLVPGFNPAQISTDGKNSSDLQNYGSNLRVRLGLNGMALYSVTGFETVRTYNRGDIDGGYGDASDPPSGPGFIPFYDETADGMPKHAQFTQEFRLESTTPGPLGWQAGLFYFNENYKIESFSYDTLTAGSQNGYERVHQQNHAYAAFGAVSYALTSNFKLRGGVRYTIDKKSFNVEDYNSAQYGTPATFADLSAGGPTSAAPSDKKFNWDLSGTYSLSKDTNLYARVATGFRGSSVQGAGFFNGQSVASPETNTSVEAGVKSELFDRRARVAFDVFHYEVKDLQLTAVGGAANSNILLNAQKAVGQGFELDLQAYLTENLLATLGAGYNDTKIEDPNLAVSFCAACTVTNPVVTLAGGSQVALINGNPLPQAPKNTLNFTLKYVVPTSMGDFYAYTDWVYRSKVNFFLYESVEFTGKALTEGGLRLGYTWGNGKYDLAAFGRNITNQIRVVGGIDFNNLTGFINDPRTYGVQFRAQF